MTFSELADYYEQTRMIPEDYIDGRKIEGLRSLYTHMYAMKIFREYFGTKKLRLFTYGEVNRFRLERLHTKTIFSRTCSWTALDYGRKFLPILRLTNPHANLSTLVYIPGDVD